MHTPTRLPQVFTVGYLIRTNVFQVLKVLNHFQTQAANQLFQSVYVLMFANIKSNHFPVPVYTYINVCYTLYQNTQSFQP